MKFYYENINYKEIPNGLDSLCRISEFDYNFGFKNPIFELSDYKEIIWNFTPNNIELDTTFFLNNLDYFKSVFLKIQNKPNVKLMFSSLHEGADISKFIECLIDLKNEFKLDKNQIIVVTINFISKQYENDIRIICKPFLLNDISTKYKKILDNTDDENGIGILSTYEYLKTPKDKFFLTYNKNVTRIHRLKFMLWLVKNNLIDECLYSLLIKNNKSDYSIFTFLSNIEYIELKGLWGYFDKLEELGLKTLDWDYANEHDNSIYSDVMNTTKSHYSKTLFNIVTETTCSDSSCSLTEKSFKPLANCHPFIIIGDRFVHNKLKELGFELYDDLIDYSFDMIYDSTKRFDAVLKEIKRIHSLGEEYILKWYKKNTDKIKRNQKVFFSYSDRYMIREVITELKMKKVLITGANGLVGTHLVRKCIDAGYDVIGVDKSKQTIEYDSYNYKFYEMDLTDEENIKNIFEFEKPDAVFNCFGVKGSPIRAKEKPVDFLYPSFKINTEIINQCAKNDIWLVFVSSVGVYSPSEKFVEEDVWKSLPSESDWFPSWSKRMGEILLEAYKVQYGYNNWSIIRPANIFGEYDDFSGNGTVISSTIKKIYEANDSIEAWGDGSPIRDFVYAGDVADAILKLYTDKINTITNFGAGEEITIKLMIEKLIKISGKDISIKWDTTKPNGDLRRQMDITKQTEIGLLPKLGFEKALEITYDYYINKLL
jgi:GDP-L-fucose synthase